MSNPDLPFAARNKLINLLPMNPNLIPCPDCYNPLSPTARHCPKCGFNLDVALQMEKERETQANRENFQRIQQENPQAMNIMILIFMIPISVILWVLYRAFFT